MDMGKYEAAMALAKKSYSIRKKVFKTKGHPKWARSLYLESSIYLRNGDYQKSKEKSLLALHMLTSFVGDNYLETAETYHLLGRAEA